MIQRMSFILVIILVATSACEAQVPRNFIGQTPDQVKEFLKTQLLEDDWTEDVNEKGDKWFYVSDGTLTPAFSWYFDKDGKCYHHSFKVDEEAPIYRSRFKQSQLRYDAKNDHWIDAKNKTSWKVDGRYVVAQKI